MTNFPELISILVRIVESARPVPYKPGEGTQFFHEVNTALLREAQDIVQKAGHSCLMK